jgi:2-dehydropantoate 2-reductase
MIAVVGAGALGGLFAGLLAEAGEDVVVFTRTADQASRLREGGLWSSGPGDAPARRVNVRFAGPDDAIAEVADLALLCVKARDTAAAVDRIARLEGAPTVIVLQNGLGRAQEVREQLPAASSRLLGAVTMEGATLEGEGRVRHAGRGRTYLAPLLPCARDRAEGVQRRLLRATLDVHLVADLDAVVWEKLQVNAAINALTGLLGCKNGVLVEAPAARALAQDAALEVAATARALEIAGDWSPEASATRWEAVARATADNVSSTLQDLRRGRPTEVFAINGAVARVARERGLSAPVNEAMARFVAAAEDVNALGRRRA